ncbi:MAG: hypothetical protein HYZ29_36015 [Myxococcales bacterium]|nr:hypothetical protein [Myxococcales bacterium]
MAAKALRTPFAWLFAAMLAAYLGVVLTAPELWLRLAAKEGPFEHAGHLTLAVALALWIGLVARSKGPARVLSTCVSAYLVFALLEELDWGAVYGLDLGHSLIARWTGGSPNLHNAQWKHGSLLGWSVAWMGAPMGCYFGLPLVPLVRVRRLWERCAPAGSQPMEGALFLGAALLTIWVDGLPLLERGLGYVPRTGAGDPIGQPLGFFQIAFYAAWALVAQRALGDVRRTASAAPAPGVG